MLKRLLVINFSMILLMLGNAHAGVDPDSLSDSQLASGLYKSIQEFIRKNPKFENQLAETELGLYALKTRLISSPVFESDVVYNEFMQNYGDHKLGLDAWGSLHGQAFQEIRTKYLAKGFSDSQCVKTQDFAYWRDGKPHVKAASVCKK